MNVREFLAETTANFILRGLGKRRDGQIPNKSRKAFAEEKKILDSEKNILQTSERQLKRLPNPSPPPPHQLSKQ